MTLDAIFRFFHYMSPFCSLSKNLSVEPGALFIRKFSIKTEHPVLPDA